MAGIILTILKVTGIILLCIILLIIAILALVLLVPVRYRGNLVMENEKPAGEVLACWLLHLVTFRAAVTPEQRKFSLKVFGIQIFPKNEKKKGEEEPQQGSGEPEDEVIQDSGRQPEDEAIQDFGVQPEDEAIQDFGMQPEDEAAQDASSAKSDSAKKSKGRQASKHGRAGRENNKNTGEAANKTANNENSLIDKAIAWKEYLLSEPVRRALSKVKDKVFALIGHVFPKKIWGRLHIGFEDPSKTGEVLAWLAVLYPFTDGSFDVEPEFDRKVLEGEVSFKGRIVLGYLLYLVLAVILDKNIRRQYKRLRQGGIANGQRSKQL